MPSPTATRYLVLIYLEPGQRDSLRRYEQRALPVFRRHGGAFERIWRPLPSGAAGDSEAPDEIHVLRFDSADGLDAVRRDPEMQALVSIRDRIVRRALLIRIEDVPLARYFDSAD
ncbi:MAG TPA: DUF1330 domain-containing protein [Methylomirabilota bacterium]|jgi:uncharacterized protein (DUF1330 family)